MEHCKERAAQKPEHLPEARAAACLLNMAPLARRDLSGRPDRLTQVLAAWRQAAADLLDGAALDPALPVPEDLAGRGSRCYALLCAPLFREESAGQAAFDGTAREILQILVRQQRGEETGPLCPDHAAMLFALFVRNARAMAGAEGDRAAREGLLLYAGQRGRRMRLRADAHGDPATMTHYLLYGEWSALPGTSETENARLTPVLVTRVHKCPWYTVWQRLGFLREGEMYCRNIDYHLVKGFSPDLELGVARVQADGSLCCEFIWNGCAMDEATSAYLARRRAELGDSCRRDWVYHTRHTFSAMAEKLRALPNGEAIVQKTMEDFETLYGPAICRCVEDCTGMDFYKV